MAAPGNRLGQVARVVILVGLALLALGNAVEAIGIWGWAGTAPGGTWQPTKAWSRPMSSVASAGR
jgi:hypothetical protein